MPVRYNKGGNTYDRDEYSFRTGDYVTSRDFARSRRFGADDSSDNRPMALVSSPLEMPFVGRRANSPYRESPAPPSHQQQQQSNYDDDDLDDEIRMVQRHRRESLENRRRIDYRQLNYDEYEEDLEPLVPTYQPRLARVSERSGRLSQQRYESPPPRYSVRQQQRPPVVEIEDNYLEASEPRQNYRRQQKYQYQENVQRQAPRQMEQEEQRYRKQDYAADDISYSIPAPRKCSDPSMEEQEESLRSIAGYIAKRKQFAVEDDEDMHYYKNPNYQYRILSGDSPRVSDREAEESMNRSKVDKAPMFDMKLRSHVVWEKMFVKFTCTVRGHPQPRVTWYKNMVPIEPSLNQPGKYKTSNQFGLHTLEISRTSIEDSGTYRVSVQNRKGEISSYATLVVRRYDGGKTGYVDMKSGYNLRKPTDYPDVEGMDIPGYPRFVIPLYGNIVEESQALILSCEVEGSPPPEVFWTLNGRTIDDTSKHLRISFDGKQATLTILKAFTDDEGEYCCRAFNSCGAATSRCYVRVKGVNAPPSAPSCVEIVDANRDFVVISWKSPGYVGYFGGSPVLGYAIEMAEAGSSVWKRWNKTLVQMTKTPITGLCEGKVYFFRVRTITRWGKSQPSLPSAAVAVRDAGTPRLPQELEDASNLLPPETDEISVEEEDETEFPGIPTDVTVSLGPDEDIVNIKWNSPDSEECEVDGYLIEYCTTDSDEWKTVNSQPMQSTDPYPVTGLALGKSYRFRVFAVNVAGCSEASECSTVIDLPEIKQESEKHSAEPEVTEMEDLAKIDDPCADCSNDKCLEMQGACSLQLSEDLQEAKDEMQVQISVPSKQTMQEPVKKTKKVSSLPSPPVDVKDLQATREYIEIGWTPPFKTAGEDPVYYIEMQKVGTEEWKICNQTPIRLTHYPVLGVEAGESYIFRVRAVTSRGTSAFSESSEPVVAADGIKPPNWWGGVQGIFRVANEKGRPCVTKNSVKVCWDAPTTDGGASILGYFLECRPAGGKFHPVNNKPLQQRHFTVDGLNPGEEFEFRVCACNIAGCGEWKTLPNRVLVKDPEPPSYPSNVLITSISEESVSLSWKKPTCLGDAEFVGYVVERCKEGSNIWIPCNKLPEHVTEEKYKVDGLVTDQTYFFRVRAVNKVGESAPSLQSCFVTPGEEWAAVEDRQNAMLEMRRKREEEEEARRQALLEEERRQAFVSGIEENQVESGQKAYFECTVKDPTTRVKWYLGDNELLPEGKYDIVDIGVRRSLMISNCQHSDIQNVTCVALYNGCKTAAYCIVDGLVPVVFTEEPKDVYINTGATANFSCNLTREDAKVVWCKNGKEISETDERYEITADTTKRSLTLKNSKVNDVAAYMVKGFGGSSTAHLVVDGVLPAEFENSIHGGEFDYEEEEAMFDCIVIPSALYKDGNVPKCAWYHNGERIEEGDDKYEIIKDGNHHKLKILNLNYEDSGEIICKCGGNETQCEISVERPPPPPPKVPVIEKDDMAINFIQGLRSEALTGSIRLYCVVATLRDDVKIFWYRNDIELDTKAKEYTSVIEKEMGLVSLVFNSMDSELRSGTYTCEFITSHKTFDTKVNFEFANGEFENLTKQAKKLQEDEDREKQARLEERKRKRAELKKKREQSEMNSSGSDQSVAKQELNQQEIEVTSDGIHYEVKDDASILLHAEVKGMASNTKITWMKNSTEVDCHRFCITKSNNLVQLRIKEPEVDDAGTYTCKIKSQTNSVEMSVDITGKVFKELLTQSAEIRIRSENDGQHFIQEQVIEQCSESKPEESMSEEAIVKEEEMSEEAIVKEEEMSEEGISEHDDEEEEDVLLDEDFESIQDEDVQQKST